MAERVPTGLTAAQGRRFGLTVGTAFLVLAAIPAWRGHLKTAVVLVVIGGALVLAGLLIPSRLGPIERGWMQFAHLISKVTTPIIMGLMYLLVLTPFGLLRRVLGGNPLVHRAEGQGFWKPRAIDRGRSNLTRQF